MKIQYLQTGQEPMTDLKNTRGGGMDDGVKKLLIVGAITVVLVALGLWGCSAQRKSKAEDAATPITAATSTIAATVAYSTEPPIQVASPQTPEPATATFIAAINRPAGNPATTPYLVGVVTYEPGCQMSNLGFTTAGYEGVPYFLYFQQPLDRDPFMQMVQVRGYIQKFKDCQYPILMVSEVFWLSGTATPAPLALEYQMATVSGTATITAAWGILASLPTPDKHATPIYDARNDPDSPHYTGVATATLQPTWTPYPTYTPRPLVPTPGPQYIYRDPAPRPTYTPYPTWTPYPDTTIATPTATPTPAKITVSGKVVNATGCSNLAIETGVLYPLIFEGTQQLPVGDPTQYSASVTGRIDTCNNQVAIRVEQILWMLSPTYTPTSTATKPLPTGEPTAEPTAELFEPTTQSTGEPAIEPTAEPTQEATL